METKGTKENIARAESLAHFHNAFGDMMKINNYDFKKAFTQLVMYLDTVIGEKTDLTQLFNEYQEAKIARTKEIEDFLNKMDKLDTKLEPKTVKEQEKTCPMDEMYKVYREPEKCVHEWKTDLLHGKYIEIRCVNCNVLRDLSDPTP